MKWRTRRSASNAPPHLAPTALGLAPTHAEGLLGVGSTVASQPSQRPASTSTSTSKAPAAASQPARSERTSQPASQAPQRSAHTHTHTHSLSSGGALRFAQRPPQRHPPARLPCPALSCPALPAYLPTSPSVCLPACPRPLAGWRWSSSLARTLSRRHHDRPRARTRIPSILGANVNGTRFGLATQHRRTSGTSTPAATRQLAFRIVLGSTGGRSRWAMGVSL